MQITVGGQTWIVNDAQLLNWLTQNATQVGAKTVVREVVSDNPNENRILLNEQG